MKTMRTPTLLHKNSISYLYKKIFDFLTIPTLFQSSTIDPGSNLVSHKAPGLREDSNSLGFQPSQFSLIFKVTSVFLQDSN